MHKILFLLLLTLFSISLEAYSKKIILASFSTQEKADEMMATLSQRSPSLYKLAKKYNFDIKMKESGKYHILVAEVFIDKKILAIALKSMKRRYKGAYATDAEVPKITKKTIVNVVEKTIKKEVTEKKVEEPKLPHFDDIDKIIPKNDIKVVQEKEASPQDLVAQVFEKYIHLYYVIFFLIFLLVSYYYVKLKKIYNGY